MIAAEHRGTRLRRQSLAQLERDAALERIGRARRWLIAAAAVLTAAFAALVSAIAPGRKAGAQARASALTGARPTGISSANRMPPLASAGDLGLQGPSDSPGSVQSPSQAAPDPTQAAPDPTQAGPAPVQSAPAPVVSGGS